jgi:hypothetical protein
VKFDVLARFRAVGRGIGRRSVRHHKYAVGQTVGLVPGHTFRGVVSGRFQVLELLPFTGGSVLYRIRSPEELFERIAGEHEITELAGYV